MRGLAPSQPAKLHFLSDTRRKWIMGVLNVTPDSFYAGSRIASPLDGQQQAAQMISEGADILDIGGESTRPGAAPVSVAEELNRVLPALDALQRHGLETALSIDTQKAEVARRALSYGVKMINDISALRHDPDMGEVVAEARCPVVLMHMQGTPETMQRTPRYGDVIDELRSFFEERLSYAERCGIAREQIILDPGIGFGKTQEHNVTILQRLSEFKPLGCPLLVGVSRKSFLSRLASHPEQVLAPEQRLEGSLAAGLWAISQGASGLRVHDVGATRRALQIWQTLADPRPS